MSEKSKTHEQRVEDALRELQWAKAAVMSALLAREQAERFLDTQERRYNESVEVLVKLTKGPPAGDSP